MREEKMPTIATNTGTERNNKTKNKDHRENQGYGCGIRDDIAT